MVDFCRGRRGWSEGYTFSAYTQLFEVSLDEKIRQSTLIVEGRVVAQESYKASDGEVYTANKVAVSAILKGKLTENYVTVTTWGGLTEEETVTWSHMLTLRPGEEGVFFLERSHVPETSNRDYPTPAFDVYSSSQGFLKFARNDIGVMVAHEPFHSYTNLKDEVYDYVAGKTGQIHTVVDASKSMLHRSGIRYFFKILSISGTTINFEILVNSLYDNELLYKAGAAVNYNTDCFGSNIATNGNLSLQTNGISTNSVYTLSKSNLTSSKAKIEMATTGSVFSLSTLTTSEQTLAKASLTIQNIFADPGISFDVADMYALSKFWDSGTAYEFDTIIVETDFNFGHFAPQIDSISPASLRAGVGDIVTIYGSGFEDDQPANGRVQFRHALVGNNGNWVEALETEYVQWDNNIIKVKVPSVGYFEFDNTPAFDNYAGTGNIRVKIGGQNSNQKLLTVRFCATNDAIGIGGFNFRYPFELRNFNTEGGYNIYFTNDFKNLGGAVDAFKRALCTWQDTTKVNFKITDVEDTLSCKVHLGTLPSGTPSSLKAITQRLQTIGCFDGDTVRVAFYRKFEMIFKKSGVTWETGTGQPPLNWSNELDLETVALHELGHAQWLEHTNNQDDVMWWQVNKYKRVLQPHDIEGGVYISDVSSDNLVYCNPGKMIKFAGDCSVNAIHELEGMQEIKIFPNPATQYISIDASKLEAPIQAASLRHITGQLAQNLEISLPEGLIKLGDIPTGVYLLFIEDKRGNVYSSKLIKF